jgi:hypothetical protein
LLFLSGCASLNDVVVVYLGENASLVENDIDFDKNLVEEALKDEAFAAKFG